MEMQVLTKVVYSRNKAKKLLIIVSLHLPMIMKVLVCQGLYHHVYRQFNSYQFASS